MSWLKNLFSQEPAVILSLVNTVIALVLAFGVQLSIEQTGAILAVTSALVGVLTRTQVSPT